jgi:hypothetical protein
MLSFVLVLSDFIDLHCYVKFRSSVIWFYWFVIFIFSWYTIIMFCRSLFVLLYFFHLAIVLSVLLLFTNSDYSFDIFKLFLCLSVLSYIVFLSYWSVCFVVVPCPTSSNSSYVCLTSHILCACPIDLCVSL